MSVYYCKDKDFYFVSLEKEDVTKGWNSDLKVLIPEKFNVESSLFKLALTEEAKKYIKDLEIPLN